MEPLLRQYIEGQIFGSAAGCRPLNPNEAEETVHVNGRKLSRGALRSDIEHTIEEIVSVMTGGAISQTTTENQTTPQPSHRSVSNQTYSSRCEVSNIHGCQRNNRATGSELQPLQSTNPSVDTQNASFRDNLPSVFRSLSLNERQGVNLTREPKAAPARMKQEAAAPVGDWKAPSSLGLRDDQSTVGFQLPSPLTRPSSAQLQQHRNLAFTGEYQQLPPWLQQHQVLQFLPQVDLPNPPQQHLTSPHGMWQNGVIYPSAPGIPYFPGQQLMPSPAGYPSYGTQHLSMQRFQSSFPGPAPVPQQSLRPVYLPNQMPTSIPPAAYGSGQPHFTLAQVPPPFFPWNPQPIPPSQVRVSTPNRTETPRSMEWSNRSGGGKAVVPAIPPLPFRPGSDDMYPRTSVSGTSVKKQELIRHGDPKLNQVLRRDVVPFAENARDWKVAEWGVLKISNVSLENALEYCVVFIALVWYK